MELESHGQEIVKAEEALLRYLLQDGPWPDPKVFVSLKTQLDAIKSLEARERTAPRDERH